MEIDIQLVQETIPEHISPPRPVGINGAWIEFRGVVRGEENGGRISALEYEAYPEMAEREIRRLITEISSKLKYLSVKVIHRTGIIPVGETAIYIGIASAHRAEAIALLAEFMDRLKKDVPIWKRRGIAAEALHNLKSAKADTNKALLQLDEARASINSHCQILPVVRVALKDAIGRVLRETVNATEDLPSSDRSTRDGYAILADDSSEGFQVVDTIHAADWKPRELKTGEAVRIATGGVLPGDGLRVVMQEHVERGGDQLKIIKHVPGENIRKRGEDMKVGQMLVLEGARLDAGKLALLATVGCAKPLVGSRLRVVHFTTGDEIIPPDKTPKLGQVRDSNSILIRGLLERFGCDLRQEHLPEDFEKAKSQIGDAQTVIHNVDLLLISGGASVGDKDFTRPLLEWLGFEIVFNQVNVRPGRPLIFGVNGAQAAFGLPGNPLSHFICFHLFVTMALRKMVGEAPQQMLRARLATKLEDSPNPRETLWPARLDAAGLHPLAWASSGDVTCLAETNALIRVPANIGSIDAGMEIEFLATNF
ncbi:MAG TPA: molybdenum cofactor biosynthesis protein MoaE [Verrucomicrobiae bacterium]|nr:molybdenum cofactor biosynthesis protein MoaE [Verrucomicrobiae bacterium]